MQFIKSNFILGLILSASCLCGYANAQEQANAQFSEDINFAAEKNIQVASSNIIATSPIKQNVNFAQMAGNFSALVKEAQNAASPQGLENANSIGHYLDNSPSLTGANSIDGAKAMVIVTALSNTQFVNSVKQISDFMGKEAFAAKLKDNVAMVKSFDGYESAYKTASASLGLGVEKIDKASAYLTQASYDLQKFGWAKTENDKHIHLIALANAKKSPANFTPINISEIVNYNSIEVQINDKLLAAAALVAIGAQDDALSLIKLGSGENCAKDAYLTLRMCVSASKYPYEHSFCLAKHAYEDANKCVKKALK
ncbi:MAG: hypothetical protein J0L55_03535 [Caulobacterales bacterium]|nr:hypothetical protein [Caulobacterales bacterium]MCA0372325.1 hypothetical protein [Pseudomonadota bacterium]